MSWPGGGTVGALVCLLQTPTLPCGHPTSLEEPQWTGQALLLLARGHVCRFNCLLIRVLLPLQRPGGQEGHFRGWVMCQGARDCLRHLGLKGQWLTEFSSISPQPRGEIHTGSPPCKETRLSHSSVWLCTLLSDTPPEWRCSLARAENKPPSRAQLDVALLLEVWVVLPGLLVFLEKL